MSRKLLSIMCAVSLLVLIAPTMECWGYDITEHKAIDDWILEHSVGGFDFDQYVRNNLGIDGGIKDKSLPRVKHISWLTFMDYKSPQELIDQGGMEEDSPALALFESLSRSFEALGSSRLGHDYSWYFQC